jgi:chaperonin GroES
MLPITLLHDRILVSAESEGERHSSGGILIPATASVGKRLTWATVVAAGPNVRHVTNGDRVLFEPEDRAVVDLQGSSYVLLRERDVHAVAAEHLTNEETGLYL